MPSWFTRLTACLLLLAGGCQSAKVADPLTKEFGGDDDEAQFEFWHQLAERPQTSNDEAFHGLLLYLHPEGDPADDYAGRVALLKERRMLPANFDGAADEAVARGDLAVAVARILGIEGGLMMRLTGGRNPRYAVLELEDAGVFPISSENQSFSGLEFVGIVGRMEDYQRVDPEVPPGLTAEGHGEGDEAFGQDSGEEPGAPGGGLPDPEQPGDDPMRGLESGPEPGGP